MAEHLITKALSQQGSRSLSNQDVVQIGKVLSASPTAQERKRNSGKEAATDYLFEVMNRAAENVARTQRRSRQRDQGMER